ncbi:histidine phosphatase family protein [Leptolyngbya iicbica]|uniref:Histidine phosphatase family protein n=2 Tax=Cyanophyceae TaxID=3028117 RepID=A0A4V2E3H9_9CYAN|nr:histidine phosphatase family protein [Leptolyngbya sp. LK]RZM82500.1 histidine phosphatase family protein [Leptolyngbya sp. LK]
MLKLLLLRHGESTSNRDRRMAGQDDAPLTALGVQQCQQLATWLYDQGWQPSHIYSSPLRRAVESTTVLLHPWQWQLPDSQGVEATPTASSRAWRNLSLAARGEHPPPRFCYAAELQEFQAGILTGLTWTEAQQRYPDLCEALVTSLDWLPIPQAETPRQGRRRAEAFVAQLLVQHRNGDAVWVMAHQWILEHLIAALMGSDRTWQISMGNTALFEFWLDCDRWSQTGMARHTSTLWQIQRFNERPHLLTGGAITTAPPADSAP